MLDYYEKNDLLPGFTEGFANIARDEHRHVAYGTWFLQQKCAEERYRARVQETLNELLPLAAGVLVPKGYSLGDDYEFFGYTSQEQAEFAYSALDAAAEGDRPVAAHRVGRLSRRALTPIARRTVARPVPRRCACSRAPHPCPDGRCAGGRRGSPRARGTRRRSGGRAGKGRSPSRASPSASRRRPASRQSAARVSSTGSAARLGRDRAVPLAGRARAPRLKVGCGMPRAPRGGRRRRTRPASSRRAGSRRAGPCTPPRRSRTGPGGVERPSRSVATPPIV